MPDNSSKRVLIIDDAALIRTYYRAALEAHDFVVAEALNVLEVFEKLLLEPFDLVIADINMPQMDGITFLRMLRSKELPVSSIPVLVTSTESGTHDMAAARSAGANFYLVKPIKQETLAEYAAIFCGP